MDISQIRLANLQLVLEEDFRGVKAHLASAIGVSPNNISRYFSDNKDHRRTVSDQIAREIERATGRPGGWMDMIHNAERDAHLEVLANEISDFTPSEIAELRAQIDLIKRRKRGEL